MILREIELQPHCYRCGTPFHGSEEQLDTWGIYYAGNGVDKITPAAIHCPDCVTNTEHTEMEVNSAFPFPR